MGSGVYVKKKKKTAASSGYDLLDSLKNKIERDLALGAGNPGLKSLDPIYYIAENFRTTFDLFGQNNAQRMAEAGNQWAEGKSENDLSAETDFPYYESTAAEKAKGDFYRNFSEITFRNGRLASAVLQNGGKTMFVSCLKRALGQSAPTNFLQSKLFSASSAKVRLKNSSAQVIFNRYTNSALGLVVESIRSARENLKVFKRLATDDFEKEIPGMKGNTLRNVCPFLSIAKDTERLVEYEERLRELTQLAGSQGNLNQRHNISAQKAILTAGISKTRGLIAKKRQLEAQFIQRLEQLLENSRQAEKDFETPGFAETVVEELLDLLEFPDDGNDDDGNEENKHNPEEP